MQEEVRLKIGRQAFPCSEEHIQCCFRAELKKDLPAHGSLLFTTVVTSDLLARGEGESAVVAELGMTRPIW